MKLTHLPARELDERLEAGRLCFTVGPFVLRLGCRVDGFRQVLQSLYAEASVIDDPAQQFIDFFVDLVPGGGARRWWRPQVVFRADAAPPFAPFPMSHAFALFEWGLNWYIAIQAHQYLMFHAAVLERDGKALLLPAQPGSGKSTLCAALMLRGWRLLSDEFGLYRPETGLIEPLPRPIPLKNESIGVIRAFSSDAVLGPIFTKTRKGDVAHLKPSEDSVLRCEEPARPAWVVFPRYLAGAGEMLHEFARGRAFLKLSGNAFNYRLQGARGFRAVADLVDACDTYYLEFGDLERAVNLLEGLVEKGVSWEH